jgi:HlyD family secretion protein
MWKWIVIAVVVIVVAAAVYASTAVPTLVDTAPVRRATVSAFVEERASTRLPRTYRITMPIDGRILPIELEAGDPVRADEIVARIELADLNTAVEMAEARVRRLQASIVENNDTRIEESTIVELDSVLESVDRSVEASQALTEAVLRHELAEAEAQLDQARRDRDRAQIRSPVDGIVLKRAVANLTMLPAGELLLEIGRLEDLQIEVEVLSEEAVDIAAGDPVDIFVPTVRHEALRGAVSRVEPRGFTKISSLGVEQQRVLVIVAFDSEALARFRAEGYTMGVGYRLRVRIYTDAHEGAVAVPRSALFRGAEDRWQAFVVRDGRARKIALDIGLLNDVEAEVLAGLDAGDEVVLAPESDLRDGARVRPRS